MRALSTLIVAVLAGVALTACGGSDGEVAAPTTAPVATQPANASREPAPDIAGVTLEGDAIALGDFSGRPVLVNVWSSW